MTAPAALHQHLDCDRCLTRVRLDEAVLCRGKWALHSLCVACHDIACSLPASEEWFCEVLA